MHLNVLPYKHEFSGAYYNRLIVEPVKIAEKITESGLVVPEREYVASQLGVVYAAKEDSEFKPGDEVQYKKSDRCRNENMESVIIDGKEYDVLYEYKVWAVNDKPYNQIFVRVVSDSVVSETSGLVIPSNVESVTRKGVVFQAPSYLKLKPGDHVEYQNQMSGVFPTATIDDVQYEVISFSDLFTINGEVAPFRIIVKIDVPAQMIKRQTAESGLRLSPLFAAMLRNLQYAEVVSIGEEAQKMFPELNVGDTAIIDHAVESQDYRLLKCDLGKETNPIYEYRVINCYDFSDREIFGKLHFKKGTNKIIDITPLNGSVFLKWEFDLFDGGGKNNSSLLLSTEDDIADYHNIDDLRNVVRGKRNEAAEKAKLKVSGIKQRIFQLHQNEEENKDQINLLMAEFAAIEKEEKRISAYLHRDHLLVCQTIHPRQIPAYIITPYEPLYPINILGHKYLIGHEDYLLFKSHKKMNISPTDLIALSDNVLVLPKEEESASLLKIPDSAVQKPQYGTVILIGANPSNIKSGDFVLFRQHAGLSQEVGGVPHLIMKQNDLLLALPAKDATN